MNIPILTVYDNDGNETPIPAIKGADGQDGSDGKSAYESAQDGGYTGTEAQFNSDLAAVGGKLDKSGGTMTGDIRLNGARLYFLDTINMVLDGTSFVGMSSNYFNFGIKTKTARLRGSALRPTYLRGDESSSSALALLSDLDGKADKPTVKSAMDSVAVAGAQYFLGTQSAVSIVLPSDAEVGQQISVVWYNGATAATLSITGTVLTVDYTPSANSRSEINALWDGTYWAVVTNEQAVTA